MQIPPWDAIAEVKRVTEVLKGYGVEPSRNTVIWMDVEDEIQMKLSTQKLTEIVTAFKQETLSTGFEFGLYMGKYLYESGEIDLTKFSEHTWIARYYNSYTIMPFSVIPNEAYKPTAITGQLWGWQYTSSGRVDGISGNVDLNVAYYDIQPTPLVKSYYQTPEFTLIDSLNKINVNSSYNNRKSIAIANGIANYTGTAEQNILLLKKLNEGTLLQSTSPV